MSYLEKKYSHDYSKYHTALLFQGRYPLLPEKFTMGNIAYALCYFENKYDTPQQIANNKRRLLDYSKDCVFSKYTSAQIETMLHDYAEAIETIRTKYRNPSAHTNELKRIDAEECFNLVLDVEKILKQMLDSFDS